MGVILSKLFIDVESIPQTGFGMVGKGGGCDVDTTPFPVRRVQLHSIQGSKLDFGWKRTAAADSSLDWAYRQYRAALLGSRSGRCNRYVLCSVLTCSSVFWTGG